MTDARSAKDPESATDAKAAWSDTGEQLTALGSKLGAHFENQRSADGTSAREQTQEAIKRLGDAVKEAFDAVGAAARDDAVKQDVKQVGRSLVGALDVTFRQVSDEVRKAFDRTQAGPDRTPAGQPPGVPEPSEPQEAGRPQEPREPGAPTLP